MFCAFFLLLSGKIDAEERIYLSLSGNDMNLGTKESPLASLDGVRDKIREIHRSGSFKDTLLIASRANSVDFLKSPPKYNCSACVNKALTSLYLARSLLAIKISFLALNSLANKSSKF